jgi:hypothetical protein
LLSFAHRYTAFPDPSVRTVPADEDAVEMTVPDPLRPAEEEAPPAAADPLAGGVLLVLALLPQAAARSAAASPSPSLAGTGTRPGIEMLMNIFSLLGR